MSWYGYSREAGVAHEIKAHSDIIKHTLEPLGPSWVYVQHHLIEDLVTSYGTQKT